MAMGVVCGIGVGMIAALCARRHRIRTGFVGNFVASVTFVALMLVTNPGEPRVSGLLGLMVIPWLIAPCGFLISGFVGAGIVALIRGTVADYRNE